MSQAVDGVNIREFRMPQCTSVDVDPSRLRIALVVARFHEGITMALLAGAVKTLEDAGVRSDQLYVSWVPGSFEIGQAAATWVDGGRVDAVICLGCVIQGETYHFELIADEVGRSLGTLARESDIPVSLGVITTRNEEQALARSGDNDENKGREAALAALQMIHCLKGIRNASRDG